MATAATEAAHWQEYDYVVINQDLDECVEAVKAILTAERLKRLRQIGLQTFVNQMLSA